MLYFNWFTAECKIFADSCKDFDIHGMDKTV